MCVGRKKSPKKRPQMKKKWSFTKTMHHVGGRSQQWQNYTNCNSNCFCTHPILHIWPPTATGCFQTSKECSRERDFAPIQKWYRKLKRILSPKTNVIPLLLGDINNLYPRIFSPAVSSRTLIKKKVQDSFDLDVFCFYFTQRYYILLFLSAHAAARPGPTAITTTSKHAWRQLPFLSKSYLYLFRKSGTKFPAAWRNNFFYQAETLKFVGTEKSTCLISLGHELKTRLRVSQGLSPSDLTYQEKGNLLFLSLSLFFFFF